jgi:hypothetical protein
MNLDELRATGDSRIAKMLLPCLHCVRQQAELPEQCKFE